MHVYFYLRGITEFVSLTKAFLKSQYWKWNIIDKDGKKQQILFQGGLRDSVLGVQEYIIPEGCLSEFLSMMGLKYGKICISQKVKTHKFKLATLRKILGCKKVPKRYFDEAKNISADVLINDYMRGLSKAPRQNVSVHLIGIKKDQYRKDKTGYYERL